AAAASAATATIHRRKAPTTAPSLVCRMHASGSGPPTARKPRCYGAERGRVNRGRSAEAGRFIPETGGPASRASSPDTAR
ncbi:MAG: hypothetical protein ACK559_35160, partial [bacterium]